MSSTSHFLPIAPASLCGGPVRGVPHFWFWEERKATRHPGRVFVAFQKPRLALPPFLRSEGQKKIHMLRELLPLKVVMGHLPNWAQSGQLAKFYVVDSRGWRKTRKNVPRKGVWLYLSQFELNQDRIFISTHPTTFHGPSLRPNLTVHFFVVQPKK